MIIGRVKSVVGPVLIIKTGFWDAETKQNMTFCMFPTNIVEITFDCT